jgi:hypothetical protein
VGAQPSQAPAPRTDLALHKLLWTHIAELRLSEDRRRKRRRVLVIALSAALALAVIVALIFFGLKN